MTDDDNEEPWAAMASVRWRDAPYDELRHIDGFTLYIMWRFATPLMRKLTLDHIREHGHNRLADALETIPSYWDEHP